MTTMMMMMLLNDDDESSLMMMLMMMMSRMLRVKVNQRPIKTITRNHNPALHCLHDDDDEDLDFHV